MPKETRTRINHMLDDGFSYRRIIEELGDEGKDLDVDHVRRWRSGG